MNRRPIYLDCHSTTPVDPIVLEAMLPWFSEHFGNPGSRSHQWGETAKDAVDQSRYVFAQCIGCEEEELVFTSGATESNNLAIFGTTEKLRRRKNRVLTIDTEHPSVLDPIERLAKDDWQVVKLKVAGSDSEQAGLLDLSSLQEQLTVQTALVSIAIANNEIGTVQPISEIAHLVHQAGALLHVDASQAVGWMDIQVDQWQADLVSFSAHKFYGPKGVGALYIRRRDLYDGARPVRLLARTWGGGQEQARRSGTLNTPGIVGAAAAMNLAKQSWQETAPKIAELRNRFWNQLRSGSSKVVLNGPALNSGCRLAHNLNFQVEGIEGQTIMALVPELGMSSGSACSSVLQGGSSVLKAIGLSDDQARCSLRLGFSRNHEWETLELAAQWLLEAIEKAG